VLDHLDELGTAFETGLQPAEWDFHHSKLELQTIKAVMNPVLFCIYIDDLLTQLSLSGVGCYIGSNFCGVLDYADDSLGCSYHIFYV